MLIVDGQIHLWEKGTPSAHHRQEPYSMAQALAGMDEAGVDRAVIHPVMWDPNSNELAVEAARAHPDRFAILGWFYLDRPESRDLIATWKNRPGMLGLRFYFNEPRMQSWPTDGTLDWLWPAAERAGIPVALAAASFLPVVGQIAERHPGPETDRRPHGACRVLPPARRPTATSRNCLRWRNIPTLPSRPPARPAMPRTRIRSAACIRICTASSTPSDRSGCSGAPTLPGCPVRGGNASRCSPRNCRG